MWLIAEEVARKMEAMWSRGIMPTAAQQEAFFAANMRGANEPISAGPSMPRNASIAGSVLEIRVEGVLTQKPDLFAWFFGGGNCTYENIMAALALAEADPTIKEVAWKFASSGGYVVGLFETLASIESCSKKMTVSASEAQSGAYALAAMAARNSKIEAVTPASMFGSIGVATGFNFCNDMTYIALTSTEAPDKRPDARTDEGKAVIVAELDAIHEVFADAIARGRGTTIKNVNATFGRGRTFLAGEAKKLGMIDKIAKSQIRAMKPATQPDFSNDQDDDDSDGPEAAALKAMTSVTIPAGIVTAHNRPMPITQIQEPPAAPQAKPESSAGAEQPKKKVGHMDLVTLQAQHPELYNQIVNSAKTEATTTERDRVNAHIEMGKACGNMDIALEAITSGSAMTQTLQAKYMSAGMNRNAVAARQVDDTAAAAAVGTAAANPTPAAAGKDLGDLVVEKLQSGGSSNTNEHGVFISPNTMKPKRATA